MSSVLIIGSTALDDVETPYGKRKNAMGGSAFYAAIASGYFARTSVLGIIGDDFPKQHLQFLKKRNIDLSGLEIVKGGKTFHWKGLYHKDMNSRDTLDLQLNTFQDFSPVLNSAAKRKKFLFLANIDPELHLDVIKQAENPSFILADTMDFWINTKLASLKKVLKKVNAFVLNDSEAKQLSGHQNLMKALKSLHKLGPKIIIIKKGEHGAILSDGKELFLSPAYPLDRIVDPTGAGDSFAGAFIGHLSAARGRITQQTLRRAVMFGTIVASYDCESFSVEKLKKVDKKDILKRYNELSRMISLSEK